MAKVFTMMEKVQANCLFNYTYFFFIVQDPKMKPFTDALKNLIKSTLQSSLYALDLQTDETYGHLWISGNSR